MMNRFALGLLLFLAVGLLGGCAARGCPCGQDTRLLFVVPQQYPDGTPTTDAAVRLHRFLAERAGGYTMIPVATGGWVNPEGVLEEELNAVYLVSTSGIDTSLEDDVRAFILSEFRQREAWVQPW